MKTNTPRICVPVCVRRADEMAAEIKRAAAGADIVELRLDCLEETELNRAKRALPEHLRQARVPVILTLRSPEQGGHTSLGLESRLDFWSSLVTVPKSCFVDLELDLVFRFAAEESENKLPFDWSRVICSHHDFAGVPENLEEICDRLGATPARILKIAVQADDATDCMPILRLLERARRDQREMIAIAMGPAGIMTRILGPSRGSFLTYGSLDDESSTAPGQLTARELREHYRIGHINKQTEIYGLMGRPVGHSISPHIHNAAFAASELNAVYIPFEVRDVVQFLRRMVHPQTRELDWNLNGLSITAPHKTAAMKSLDWIEPAARDIGAVNTIVIQGEQLLGYNTDAAGFIAPLLRKYGSLKGARCAVIGAGGAARAALWGLRKERAHTALFVRDLEKAKLVAEELGVECHRLTGASFERFDVVVNATPLGTRGEREDETPATADQLRNVRLAYDLVYNPFETRFQCEARLAGCETIAGVEMLVAQAVEQFKLWTGREPNVEEMQAAAMQALAS